MLLQNDMDMERIEIDIHNVSEFNFVKIINCTKYSLNFRLSYRFLSLNLISIKDSILK